MPLLLKDMLGVPKPLAIELCEGKPSLNITYYPEFLSEEFEQRAKVLADGEDAARKLADLVSPIIAAWDVEDLALSRENLVRVPSGHLSKIISAIMDDARPNSASADNSGAG